MRTDTATLPFAKGDILVERYRVERLLGRGGMGVVVAAQNVLSGDWVALKLLLPDAAQNPEAVERFVREAKASSRIESQHIARVSDVGTLPSGLPYIAMELLEGHDLGELLAKRRVLPVSEAVDYVLEALDPVAEAHSLGIIHRDLKPSNLFLAHNADGSTIVKILDFGISKATGPDAGLDGKEGALTATSSMIGSPAYMSPEQIKSSKKVDARSDIWSVGVILYEALAGRLPFIGDTVGEVLAEVIEGNLVPIKEHRPDIPAELDAVVCKALARKREDRYASVPDLAAALAPFSSARVLTVLQRIAEIESRMALDRVSLPSGSSSYRARSGSQAGLDPARTASPTLEGTGRGVAPAAAATTAPLGEAFGALDIALPGDEGGPLLAKAPDVQTGTGWGSHSPPSPGGPAPAKVLLISAASVFAIGVVALFAVVSLTGPSTKPLTIAAPPPASSASNDTTGPVADPRAGHEPEHLPAQPSASSAAPPASGESPTVAAAVEARVDAGAAPPAAPSAKVTVRVLRPAPSASSPGRWDGL